MAPFEQVLPVRAFGSYKGKKSFPASYYPEVVGVLSVLASPYWQRLAGSGDVVGAFRFYRQVASAGLTNGNAGENTSLRIWIVKLREETRLDAVA